MPGHLIHNELLQDDPLAFVATLESSGWSSPCPAGVPPWASRSLSRATLATSPVYAAYAAEYLNDAR